MNLKGRNFLTLKDFTPEEITYLIDLSAELKAKKPESFMNITRAKTLR
jgi:ornithine carbamoyltransferase